MQAGGGELPPVPPEGVREEYRAVSRAYARWCVGMLGWSLLCVVYFIATSQVLEMIIGLGLGALMVAMIFFPAVQFGGVTWYKRLGWGTVLSALLGVMFVYPLVVIAVGIGRRVVEGRYVPVPSFNDAWHLVLSTLTVVMCVWTGRVAVRAGKLVKRLQRGEY